ncbi:MAG: sugar phosphate nucleotidyltransferase [Asticcacaulis sp.]
MDFSLSNALNSGIRRFGVATQYKAHSLIRHLQYAWNFFRPERNESFDILPASQRVSETQWYEGTADAVFQNIDIIVGSRPRIHADPGRRPYLQDGFRADCCASIATRNAECHQSAAWRLPRAQATAFGVMAVDESDQITAFVEKPADPPAMPGKPDVSLVSMGIYVFRTKFSDRAAQGRRPPIPVPAATSARTSSPHLCPARQGGGAPLLAILRPRRTTNPRPTGAMSARSTPIGRPIWT